MAPAVQRLRAGPRGSDPLARLMNPFETTLQRPVSIEGVGLHSGAPVSLTMHPAPAGSGLVFVRSDLDDFPVPADWRYVARVSYATSLMRHGVLVSTTEHLLSALYGMGIDNVRLEINNLEAPIADGSSLPFVEMIQRAGVRTLDQRREFLRIRKPIEVIDGLKRVRIEPADRFEIACRIDFDHPNVGRQTFEVAVDPNVFAKDIAAARTFGFERDLEQMRDMGLIRGATIDNAVCFSDEGVINPGGLRFDDEPCRHKALDLIGDLALLGRPLLGRVTAARAGHAAHAALVRRIMSDPSCYELTRATAYAAAV